MSSSTPIPTFAARLHSLCQSSSTDESSRHSALSRLWSDLSSLQAAAAEEEDEDDDIDGEEGNVSDPNSPSCLAAYLSSPASLPLHAGAVKLLRSSSLLSEGGNVGLSLKVLLALTTDISSEGVMKGVAEAPPKGCGLVAVLASVLSDLVSSLPSSDDGDASSSLVPPAALSYCLDILTNVCSVSPQSLSLSTLSQGRSLLRDVCNLLAAPSLPSHSELSYSCANLLAVLSDDDDNGETMSRMQPSLPKALCRQIEAAATAAPDGAGQHEDGERVRSLCRLLRNLCRPPSHSVAPAPTPGDSEPGRSASSDPSQRAAGQQRLSDLLTLVSLVSTAPASPGGPGPAEAVLPTGCVELLLEGLCGALEVEERSKRERGCGGDAPDDEATLDMNLLSRCLAAVSSSIPSDVPAPSSSKRVDVHSRAVRLLTKAMDGQLDAALARLDVENGLLESVVDDVAEQHVLRRRERERLEAEREQQRKAEDEERESVVLSESLKAADAPLAEEETRAAKAVSPDPDVGTSAAAAAFLPTPPTALRPSRSVGKLPSAAVSGDSLESSKVPARRIVDKHLVASDGEHAERGADPPAVAAPQQQQQQHQQQQQQQQQYQPSEPTGNNKQVDEQKPSGAEESWAANSPGWSPDRQVVHGNNSNSIYSNSKHQPPPSSPLRAQRSSPSQSPLLEGLNLPASIPDIPLLFFTSLDVGAVLVSLRMKRYVNSVVLLNELDGHALSKARDTTDLKEVGIETSIHARILLDWLIAKKSEDAKCVILPPPSSGSPAVPLKRPLSSLTIDQVSQVLSNLNLQRYCNVFSANAIDGETLAYMKHTADFKLMGIIPAHAKKLVNRLQDLRHNGVPTGWLSQE